MEIEQLKTILEASIFAAGEPVSLQQLANLFQKAEKAERPSKSLLKQALAALEADYQRRGIHLHQVASGYFFHTSSELSQWVSGLWAEKRPRYTRAFLETLAIIAYKQPVTRGDIEAIRGVSVNPTIIKILLEHEWIQSVGQRAVPGRPQMYGTTQQFLDHFNLKTLEELPAFPSVATLSKLTEYQAPVLSTQERALS
jgi:segregation and condensation protein B